MFNMFDSKSLVRMASDGNLTDLKFTLSKYNFTCSYINSFKDNNNNNLLHLATQCENAEMVKYLLNIGVSHIALNKFNKSPWDLAVMIRNKEVINEYVTFMGKKSCDHLSELSCLRKDNLALKESLAIEQKLNKDNSVRINLLGNAHIELNSLRKKNTELVEENTALRVSLKRSRDDNEELQQSNKKLKLSVQTLMESTKKK